MKKLLKLFVIVTVSLFLTGCIQLQTKIFVNKDGSGTLEETVLMSKEMIKMMNEFIMGFTVDTTEVEEFNLYNEEDLKNRVSELGEGVTFVAGTEIKEEDKEGYKVVYNFSAINKIRIDQNPDSRIPTDSANIEMQDKEYVTFNFNPGDISEIKIKMPFKQEEYEKEEETEEEIEASKDSLGEADISQMKFFIKDLSMSFVIDVEGEITETNSDYQQENSITLFNLSFGELLDNTQKLKELKKINPDNLLELKEIMKDIPGIKIETHDPVIIKFR
jgi:hypothetical protein